jgi:hypothetical protein
MLERGIKLEADALSHAEGFAEEFGLRLKPVLRGKATA